MDLLELIASPAFAFLISILTALSIYLFGKMIAPPFRPNKDKVAPYACGEYFPPRIIPMRILFFQYAVLFLIFDITSMIIIFSMGVPPLDPFRLNIIYLVSLYVLVALLALYVSVRRLKHGIY